MPPRKKPQRRRRPPGEGNNEGNDRNEGVSNEAGKGKKQGKQNGQLNIRRMDASSCGFMTTLPQWDNRSGLAQLETAYRKVEAVVKWYDELLDVINQERVKRLSSEAKRRHAPLDVMLVLVEVETLLNYWKAYAVDASKEMERIGAAAIQLQDEQRIMPDDGRTQDGTAAAQEGGKKKRRGQDGNNGRKGPGVKGKKQGGKDGDDKKRQGASCRFMSIPYDDVASPGAAYNRVDEAYEWYEDFFVAFDYDRMSKLLKDAVRVGAPESAAVALGIMRTVFGELQKRFVELHRERSRLYVLAMQEHARTFVDAETRAVIKADTDNEDRIRQLFKDKKLEYGSHIMIHRFMALTNRVLRNTAFEFMVASAGGVADGINIDETFRRLDYDPREDNFFVTFGGSDDVTIKFQIQSAGYPDAQVGRGGIMHHSRFLNEHSNTIRIVDSAFEDVGEVLFDGRTMTRRAPSLHGRLLAQQRPRFAQDNDTSKNKKRSQNRRTNDNNYNNDSNNDGGRIF